MCPVELHSGCLLESIDYPVTCQSKALMLQARVAQANCRQAAGSTNGSLLEQWISKVVATYSTKVSWPLISMKLDDQLAYAKVSLAPTYV